MEKTDHTTFSAVSKINFNCDCIKIAVVGIGEGKVWQNPVQTHYLLLDNLPWVSHAARKTCS